MTSMAEKVLGNQTQSAEQNEPSSLKHNGPTPGTWTVDVRSEDCAYLDGPPRSYDECYFENAADARLIAAAPELLAALQECERMLGIRRDFVPLGPALVLAPIIRAAIAKAMGAA